MNEEILQKAKKAESAEELIKIAKESGYELSEKKAQEYFERLNSDKELTESELSAAAGGCGSKSSATGVYCPNCGSEMEYSECVPEPYASPERSYVCYSCGYMMSAGLF